MGISRYRFSSRLESNRKYGTSTVNAIIFNALESGSINYDVVVLSEGQRLDHIAHRVYGSSEYWWIVAAASGVGWGLQLPAGTVIRIPANLNEVLGLL
jgi:hypothetical protein